MTTPHPLPEQLDFQYETALLAEECGEVTQIIGKSLRFGWSSYNPADPTTSNLDLLHTEVGDVLAAIELAKVRGLLDGSRLEARKAEKFTKLLTISPQPSYGYGIKIDGVNGTITTLTSSLGTTSYSAIAGPVTPEPAPQASVITQESTVSTKIDTGLTAAQEKAAAAVSIAFAIALLIAAWVVSGTMARESFRLEAAQAAAQCYQDAVTMDVSASTCEALKKLSDAPATPVTNAPTGN